MRSEPITSSAAAEPLPSLLDGINDFTREAEFSVGEALTGSAVIHGENLAVLDSLGDAIRGRVKCVYIDPPYNNAEVYRHYDDRLGRRVWLDRMTHRLRGTKGDLNGRWLPLGLN